MRRNSWFVSFLWLLLACVPISAQESLNTEWLNRDIDNINRLLPELSRAENHSLQRFEEIFRNGNRHVLSEQVDLGFGAKSFLFSTPGGYTHFSVDGIAVNDRIAKCRITVGGSSSWPMIRVFIIDAWKAVGPADVKEREERIRRDYEYPDVLAEYKALVAAQLGPLKSVKVPSNLRSGYEYLISLDENSVVSSEACGYGGVPPIGGTLIADLVKARRVDLIENILRGHNPGGRVYALLALLKLQSRGTKLSDQTLRSMSIVRELEIPIETCSGCIYQHQRATAIINDAK